MPKAALIDKAAKLFSIDLSYCTEGLPFYYKSELLPGELLSLLHKLFFQTTEPIAIRAGDEPTGE